MPQQRLTSFGVEPMPVELAAMKEVVSNTADVYKELICLRICLGYGNFPLDYATYDYLLLGWRIEKKFNGFCQFLRNWILY